jgi:hypothetical protein
MKTIVFLMLLGLSGVALADPFCILPACRSLQESQRAELQAYLEYLKQERDAGRLTEEKMRHLYYEKEAEQKEKRSSATMRPQVIVR